ncbi:MAG: ice-binding family protein [Sulfobacillus sp.]
MSQSPRAKRRLIRLVRLRERVVDMVALTTVASLVLFGGLVGPAMASASSSPAPISLQTAGSFAILAQAAISNTGASVITGNIGLYPGTSTSVTGFSSAVVNGTTYTADATAQQAMADLSTAYNTVTPTGTASAGDTSTTVAGGLLDGQTFGPGVYNYSSGLDLTTTVTLDAYGNSNAVFIFQAGSTLTTASASSVVLTNGAQACNVFWQVGSSATLGSTTAFIGTIMAATSASLDQGASVDGRVLAGAVNSTGAVTLIDNAITVPTCASPTTTTTPTPTSTALTTAASSSTITLGNSVTDVATVTSANGATPSGSVQFYACAVGDTACTSSAGTALTPAETLINGVATSPSVTPAAVGTYCFAAVYSPNSATFAASSETSTTANTECFAVTATPIPTISTTPSATGVVLGTSVTDSATLVGTTAGGTPTGSVQFYACGPNSALCAPSLGTAFGPSEPLVGGAVTSSTFTPTLVGLYCFSTAYSPSGTTYAGVAETGSTINGECFNVTAPVVIPPVVVPPVVVPAAHTGEPWAGWVYWALIGAAGILGITLAMQGVTRRRSTRRTEH